MSSISNSVTTTTTSINPPPPVHPDTSPQPLSSLIPLPPSSPCSPFILSYSCISEPNLLRGKGHTTTHEHRHRREKLSIEVASSPLSHPSESSFPSPENELPPFSILIADDNPTILQAVSGKVRMLCNRVNPRLRSLAPGSNSIENNLISSIITLAKIKISGFEIIQAATAKETEEKLMEKIKWRVFSGNAMEFIDKRRVRVAIIDGNFTRENDGDGFDVMKKCQPLLLDETIILPHSTDLDPTGDPVLDTKTKENLIIPLGAAQIPSTRILPKAINNPAHFNLTVLRAISEQMLTLPSIDRSEIPEIHDPHTHTSCTNPFTPSLLGKAKASTIPREATSPKSPVLLGITTPMMPLLMASPQSPTIIEPPTSSSVSTSPTAPPFIHSTTSSFTLTKTSESQPNPATAIQPPKK